jgi:hypothetical protein
MSVTQYERHGRQPQFELRVTFADSFGQRLVKLVWP